jgi:glycosyltransferase involved in cell wall biosynthesis
VLLHSPALPTILERVVQRVRPDVVLSYCSGMARYALTPPLDAMPFVLDMVDVDSEKWAALGRSSRGPLCQVYRREARVLRAFEAAAARRAYATTVVNDRERLAMQAVCPGALVQVIPNGIDVEGFRPSAAPVSEPRVVFCGVFDYEPNVTAASWLAEQVWPLVLRDRPEATLTLVGMNPTARVRALANASIVVTGAVPDVRTYLWRAAVAAAPLQVARGLQNKVLEAVAAGLPCVVTSAVREGLPGSVRNACRTADDPATYAQAILDLLNLSPTQRREVSGMASLDKLSWEHQLAGMSGLLQAAADGADYVAYDRARAHI